MSKENEFFSVIGAYIINAKDKHTLSDYATIVSIIDEGGGLFVEIRQSGDETNIIQITNDEWILIKHAVDTLFGSIAAIELDR